jgi:hypothetical protein
MSKNKTKATTKYGCQQCNRIFSTLEAYAYHFRNTGKCKTLEELELADYSLTVGGLWGVGELSKALKVKLRTRRVPPTVEERKQINKDASNETIEGDQTNDNKQ